MHRVFTVDADPLCEIATSSRNRKYIACCEKATEPSRLPATAAGPENVVKLRRAVLEIRAVRVFTVVAGRRRRKQRTDLLGRLDCQTATRVRLPSPGWSPSHRHRTSRGRSPRCRLVDAAAVQHGLGRLDSVLRAADRPRSSSSHTSIVHPAAVALSSRSEADLGMFSMFGRTAAPTKGRPTSTFQ